MVGRGEEMPNLRPRFLIGLGFDSSFKVEMMNFNTPISKDEGTPLPIGLKSSGGFTPEDVGTPGGVEAILNLCEDTEMGKEVTKECTI